MSNINNVLWALQLGGIFPDAGISIAADTFGNTYVTGAFNGTATFGNTTLTSTGFGYSDAFIAKFDSNNNILWAQKLGGTLTDVGLGITVDEAGNSYATGFFSGIATFGSTTLTSTGNEDAFITKLDSNGNVLWAQKLGGTESDSGLGITTDAIGNIYATGALNANSSDTFIHKLDQNGNILWTKNLGGTSPDSGFGITNDKDGNTYVSGFFRGTATFGSTTLTSAGNEDAFITKLDSSGNFLWAKSLGGISDDRGRGIIVDETGNAYFTGYFSVSATFGSTTFNSAGNADAFVAKLDNNGNTLWAKNLGGTESDEGYGIVADEVGNIYVSGLFSSTGTFGNSTLSSTGDSDAFIAKLDSNGNVLSAQKFGGVSSDLGTGIATDGKGNIYATGGFSDTATFGNITLTSAGNTDAFVVKLGEEVEQPKITLALTPNSVAEDSSNNLIYTFTRDGDTTNPQIVNFNIGGNATYNIDYTVVANNTYTGIGGTLTVKASDTTATVTINPTADNLQTVNFNIGSNATYNTDYTTVGTNTFTGFNGTVAFKAGDTTATVTINPTADTIFEADETVSLTLTSGTGYTIATSEAVTGEITNDDTQINLAVNNVLWAKQLGGTSYDVGWGIAADASGNTYVMGDFSDTVTFGNTSLTSGVGNDSFITKLDSSGNVLWAQKLGGSSYRTSSGISVDSSGNTYATGFFFAPATFGNMTLTSAGEGDAFITKLDSSGNFLWAQQLGGTSFDIALGISVDSSGNSYVTGSFSDTATFGNITLTSTGDDDGFITKLDSRGNFLWAQQLGGTSYASGEAIASDGAGNTYVTGYFSDTATFGNTTLTSTRGSDGFITKLDSNGNFLWAQKLAGGSRGKGITIDSSGNTYVTENDAVITKLDSSGKFLWAKKLDSNVSEVTGITVDNSGNIYVTGSFSDTASFGSITLTSAGDGDAFIAKLDSNGKFLSAQNFGGTSDDRGLDITSDGKGNIYATGGFDNTATFDKTSLTSTGSIDAFVVKLGDKVEEPKITTLNGGNITISTTNLTVVSNDTVREPKITLALNNTDSVFNLGGAATPVQFVLKSASPGVVNEIGLFTVDDDKGTIDGIAPNDSNYTQAALARSRSIFSTLGNSPNGFDSNLTRTLDLDGGIRFRLLLVQNGTLDGLRNGTVSLSQLRLSSPTSLQVSDAGNSNFDLRFEDSPGSGQFNDAVVQMQLGTQADKPIGTALQDQQEGEVLDLRGLIGMQNATFTVNREAAYNNFVGFFRVADVKGGIDTNGDGIGDLLPGQAGYGEAAVKNRVGGIDLSVGNQGKATFTGQFEAGSVFAPFLIVNGTPEQLLDSNPNNNPAIYFPYLGANSDIVDHVRILGNNVFGFEDLPNGGDKDFNDIIVSVKFG
ncbi:beta strand repeat-containing protein [Nostoc sp. UIC 10607]|uniref:beta strand repeat-containing protein n=1 Tax=Nostoc sp. UIC 10607 TaxID=3045935 RepID=UPI00399FF1F0